MRVLLQESEYFEQGGMFHGLVPDILGSKLDLIITGASREGSESLWKRFCDYCRQMDAILNWNDPESEVGKFNAGKMLAHTSVSDELGEAVDLCKAYRSLTGGLFDAALGKMNYVDHDEEDGSLSVYGAKLDFGSFARGYLLRGCRRMLEEAGIGCAFANYGNHSFLAVGSHPYGDAWKVGLTNPFTRMPLEEISLKDCAMALSCNAPGATGHVIDPRNGRPVEDKKMTVVTAPDILDAKVMATAAMIAGPAETERLKEAFPEAELQIYNL